MAVLEPEMAILDETDSGLDIDALRIVAEGVNAMLNPNSASCSSPTTSACSTTSSRTSSTSWPRAASSRPAARTWPSRLEDEGYGPILREAGLSPDVPDEALLRPQGPDAELEPVRGRRG